MLEEPITWKRSPSQHLPDQGDAIAHIPTVEKPWEFVEGQHVVVGKQRKQPTNC